MLTKEQIVEAMAKSAHDAWHRAYVDLGYVSRLAAWGEEFMVPYEELSERGKEFDRVIMRGILDSFATNGLQVVETGSSGFSQEGLTSGGPEATF